MLPMHPNYPADMFTSCLTTPINIAIRWFILQHPETMKDLSPDLLESLPGKDIDRKTPRGELNWIFTAITDTIAWSNLPSRAFQKMFREDPLVASLFRLHITPHTVSTLPVHEAHYNMEISKYLYDRNFLLAKRIMKTFHCSPQSWPQIPDCSTHHLWLSWDLTLESFLLHHASQIKCSTLADPRNNMSLSLNSSTGTSLNVSSTNFNLTFFSDHLTAFELWLDYGEADESPTYLPILLQVNPDYCMRLLTNTAYMYVCEVADSIISIYLSGSTISNSPTKSVATFGPISRTRSRGSEPSVTGGHLPIHSQTTNRARQ